MTESKIIEAIKPLTNEQQVRWMRNLGYNLTVAARSFYEAGTMQAEGTRLRGFNEIHHRLYTRMRHLMENEEWTIESFVAMLDEQSRAHGIEHDVVWAIKQSMPTKLN
jgi:hypothetical protein